MSEPWDFDAVVEIHKTSGTDMGVWDKCQDASVEEDSMSTLLVFEKRFEHDVGTLIDSRVVTALDTVTQVGIR